MPPKRQRNSFFLHVTNLLGNYQLHAGYKTTKGDITSLSTSKANAPVKIPFGPPISCEYRVRNISVDEHVAEFKFTNSRNQTVAMKDTLLNNLELKIDNFGRKITSLATADGSKKLLALYISLTNFSEDFIHHRDGVHDSNGFPVSGGEEVITRILEAGGSLEDYKHFVALAKESALMVDSPQQAIEQIHKKFQASKKRKAASSNSQEVEVDSAKKPKLSKPDLIKENERKELEDNEGLEKKYQESFCGVGHIPLDNISVAPQMKLKINPFRVQYIMQSMKKRYNPAISVLVVCPVDDSKKMNIEKDKFYVVQKTKCLEAFKLLDKQGDFEKMFGHKGRLVLCYILNTNSLEVIQYGNLSENFVTGQFASRTVPQDLLHQFHCLTMKDSNVKALKVVDRMSRLCCLRSEECTALERLCKWSRIGFNTLMTVIEKFEKYQTLDIKNASGIKERIARGEKLNMTNVLLRLLGKVSEKYFIENYDCVIKKSISLTELAENYQELVEVEKVFKVLCKIADYVPVETIQRLHPGKFSEEKMKSYLGAIYDEKVKNQKTKELEKYYNFVISSNSDEVYSKPVELRSYEEVSEVFEDDEIMDSIDMIIYNMVTTDNINSILNTVIGGDKPFQAALLLFPCEIDYFNVLSFLRKQDDTTKMIKDFEIVPLFFNAELKKGVAHGVGENIKFGLVFGKFTLLKSPLLVHYSDLSQIIRVVESICPPLHRVGVISDPGLSPIKVHNQDLEWRVSYFGAKLDLDKFKKVLESDKNSVAKKKVESEPNDHENNDPDNAILDDDLVMVNEAEKRVEVNVESDNVDQDEGQDKELDDMNVASTSTTPSKSSNVGIEKPTGLDDSGFMEQSQQSVECVSKSLDFVSEMDMIAKDI